MKIMTNVKAWALADNHNQTVKGGIKVKTRLKAGEGGTRPPPEGTNNNQTIKRGLKVESSVRAGLIGLL